MFTILAVALLWFAERQHSRRQNFGERTYSYDDLVYVRQDLRLLVYLIVGLMIESAVIADFVLSGGIIHESCTDRRQRAFHLIGSTPTQRWRGLLAPSTERSLPFRHR